MLAVEDKMRKDWEEHSPMERLTAHELFKTINDTYIPGLLLLGPKGRRLYAPKGFGLLQSPQYPLTGAA